MNVVQKHLPPMAAGDAARPDLDSTQRTETCAKVGHNRPRLLPRREVPAFGGCCSG